MASIGVSVGGSLAQSYEAEVTAQEKVYKTSNGSFHQAYAYAPKGTFSVKTLGAPAAGLGGSMSGPLIGGKVFVTSVSSTSTVDGIEESESSGEFFL